MDRDFDFNNIGMRMPYAVPDGFFAEMQSGVMQRVGMEAPQAGTAKCRNTMKVVMRSLLAVAAAVALFFVVRAALPKTATPDGDFASVELAFNNLSADDQDFLLTVYEEDLFINEPDNQE